MGIGEKSIVIGGAEDGQVMTAEEMFKMFDSDNDGKIGMAEFSLLHKHILKHLLGEQNESRKKKAIMMIAFVLLVFLCVSVGANGAVVFYIVADSVRTTVSGDVIVSKTSNVPVATRKVMNTVNSTRLFSCLHGSTTEQPCVNTSRIDSRRRLYGAHGLVVGSVHCQQVVLGADQVANGVADHQVALQTTSGKKFHVVKTNDISVYEDDTVLKLHDLDEGRFDVHCHFNRQACQSEPEKLCDIVEILSLDERRRRLHRGCGVDEHWILGEPPWTWTYDKPDEDVIHLYSHHTEPKGCYCHPAKSTLELASGAAIRLDALTVGDVIRTPSGYEQVLGFLHADPTLVGEYFTFRTASNKAMQITTKHWLPVNGVEADPATVIIGDVIKTVDGDEVVVSIEQGFEIGAYLFVVWSGLYYVDGIVASTYAEHIPQFAWVYIAVPYIRLRYALGYPIVPDGSSDVLVDALWPFNLCCQLSVPTPLVRAISPLLIPITIMTELINVAHAISSVAAFGGQAGVLAILSGVATVHALRKCKH